MKSGGQTCTTTSTTTTTTTPAPTTTTSTTTTTTTLACQCWSIYNEGATTGNYTITSCGGTVSSPNLLPGANRTHCLQGGTAPQINSGLLTDFECGNTCTIGNDCSYCGPTTTTSTTTTTTTAATTSTTTTTTTAETTSTTTTTTTLACVCWTIYNEGGTTGNYTITNCNGTVQSPNLIPGASRSHCLQAGTAPQINSGLLTDIDCGTPCNVAGDCSPC